MNPEANRIQYLAALNLAIVYVQAEASNESAPTHLKVAALAMLDRLQKKRAELEEQFENRTGGS